MKYYILASLPWVVCFLFLGLALAYAQVEEPLIDPPIEYDISSLVETFSDDDFETVEKYKRIRTYEKEIDMLNERVDALRASL